MKPNLNKSQKLRLIAIIILLLAIPWPAQYLTHWYVAAQVDQTQLIEFGYEEDFVYCQKWRPELLDRSAKISGYKEQEPNMPRPYVVKNFVNAPREFHLLPWAARNNYTHILKILLEQKISKDSEAWTALTIAAQRGNLASAKLLAGKIDDIDYNSFHPLSWTPLLAACDGKHVSMVKLLLDHGADPNQQGLFGWTALDRSFENPEILELLLKAAADADRANIEYGGVTPLFAATINAKVESIKVLLKYGANADIKNRFNQETVLHTAVNKENYLICKLLLEAGADPNIKDKQNMTPIEYTYSQKIADLLLKHGAKKPE